MSLTEQLKKLADNSAQRHPGEAQVLMKNAIDELKTTTILEQALKTGDSLPQIELPNATGSIVKVNEILAQGKKVVLAFYRGGWCPYCNLELRALQQYLPQIQAQGAELIAISPETPDNSLSTTEKNELTFEVLSDENNVAAKALNLVYQIPEYLNELYKTFGIDLEVSQDNAERELPIAATYVIDTNGKITYHFLEEDYKLRADPQDILEALS
jgi:peroxiredoxin